MYNQFFILITKFFFNDYSKSAVSKYINNLHDITLIKIFI